MRQQIYALFFWVAPTIYICPAKASITREEAVVDLLFLPRSGFLMKNDKTTLVLMAGLPGAGKSTLAFALGRALNWHVIDKDGHKEVLLRQGIEAEAAGNATYELAFAIARNSIIKQHASVILDSAALHPFILDNALSIVHSTPGTLLKVILCVADRFTRDERLRTRPYQLTNIRVNPETIADYLALFTHLPSNTLTIYTIEPLDSYLEKAIDYLKTV